MHTVKQIQSAIATINGMIYNSSTLRRNFEV